MPGSRRARQLATTVQSALARALEVAEGFEQLAGDLRGTPDAPILPAGPAAGAAERAAEVATRYARGLASAPWDSPEWYALGGLAEAEPAAPVDPLFGERAALPSGSEPAPPPPPPPPSTVRPGLWQIGEVDVPAVATDELPTRIPLVIPLLDASNLRIVVPPAERDAALAVIRGLVTRVLAAVPAGDVELTVYDPHELGAGLAGLGPLRAARLLGPTITTRPQLEMTLGDLSAEVGRITTERLAGRYASLRERQEAGTGRGEPWRLLVLLDWPSLLSDDAEHALAALANQGPACGLSVLAVQVIEDQFTKPELLSRSEVLTAHPNGRWTCTLTGDLRCHPDTGPPADLVAHIARHTADAAGKDGAKPLDLVTLLPDRLWLQDSADGLHVPIGQDRDGPVEIAFDDDTVHALVGGQAGAGKSTLLLDIVYGLAARYGPDQLRMVLLDFKEGLEFAQFAPRPRDPFALPHADVVGVDSDREYGVAVLRHVRAEMQRRATAMRAYGVRHLSALREADPASRWPRLLVAVDEFQVLLTPMDGVAREAVEHLEVLARQGRAYGIHLLLASQTLSGIDALDGTVGKRGSIFGQFALRVALRTSSSESRVILSSSNEAAGALVGVGTAVLNRRNGHPEGNEIVRVAFPGPRTLERVRAQIASATPAGTTPPRLFIGHEPAVLDTNADFIALTAGSAGSNGGPRAIGPGEEEAPVALVGAPLDLQPPAVGVPLTPLPGRHLAVLGPLRREAIGAVQAATLSAAGQLPPGRIHIDLLSAAADAEPALQALARRLRDNGHPADVHPVGGLLDLLDGVGAEIRLREERALAAHLDGPGPNGQESRPMRLVVLLAVDAARAGLESRHPVSRRSGLDELRFAIRRGSAQRVHLVGWWRGPRRFLDDLGANHRDDVAAWLAVGVPAGDLTSLAGNRLVPASPGANRAVLHDRDHLTAPRTVVPFAPLAGSLPVAGLPDGAGVGR